MHTFLFDLASSANTESSSSSACGVSARSPSDESSPSISDPSSFAVDRDGGKCPDNELETIDVEEREDNEDVGGDCAFKGGDSICCGMARAVTVARGLGGAPTWEDTDGVRE